MAYEGHHFESFNTPVEAVNSCRFSSTALSSKRVCLGSSYFSPFQWHVPKAWELYKLDQESLFSEFEKWAQNTEVQECLNFEGLINILRCDTPVDLVENFTKLGPTFAENMEAALNNDEDLLKDPIFKLSMEELGAENSVVEALEIWLKASAVFWKSLTEYKSVNMSLYNFLNNERIARMVALHITRHLRSYLSEKPASKRDQGWSPTRVLIITPTKQHALTWLECLRSLSQNMDSIGKKKKKKRLRDYYRNLIMELAELNEDGTINAESALGLTLLKTDKRKVRKPLDFIDAFRGNNDDDFIFGLELLDEKVGFTVLKDYQLGSVVVTSVTTLMRAIGQDENENENDSSSDEEREAEMMMDEEVDEEGRRGTLNLRRTKCTWLSSVEIFVIDRADHLMQVNCEHLLRVVSELNLPPAIRPKRVDIGRLRLTHLTDPEQSLLKRQTILLSQGRHNILNSLMRMHDGNIRGLVSLWRAQEDYLAKSLLSDSSTTFLAVRSEGPEGLTETFRSHFVDSFHARLGEERTLIVAPSYLEYIELQQLIKSGVSTDNYASCHEESEDSEIGEARRMIQDGSRLILLVTERFLFHRRFRIKGFQHVVYFGAPKCLQILLEVCQSARSIRAGQANHVVLIYWDRIIDQDSMARILGARNMQKALSSGGGVTKIPLLVVADLILPDDDNRR